MQSSHSLLTFPLRPLPMLLQSIVLSLLVPSSLFRHLSGWQVRSFVDASSIGDHSFPRLKQSLLWSAQLLLCAVGRNRAKYRLHQPAFIPLHFTTIRFFIPHSTPFATPQQHTCMAARLLPSHLFSARRPLSSTHTMLQRPSSTKTHLNVTRPSIQASC